MGAVGKIEWACIQCGCCIQNDWVMNQHQILCQAWTFIGRNYLDDSEGCIYGQLVIGSFIRTMRQLMHHFSCKVFWQNIKSLRWLSPLQPRFGALWLLAFPKTKITFEREEISDHQWDSEKYNRAADGNWKNCVRWQGAYFEGDWDIIVLCTVFLVSFSINVSIFHITWLDRPCIYVFTFTRFIGVTLVNKTI